MKKEEQSKKEKSKTEKNKKEKVKKEKVKKENFFIGVKNEMKKVHWPDKKYIIKYTIVTLVFVIVLSGYFYLISALMSFLKVWLG